MKLDIIVPVYNNEKKIKDFYNEIHDLLKDIKYNILFINNSSTDNSENILKEIQKKDGEHIKIITLSKPFDKNSAILAGLKYAKNDLVCVTEISADTKYVLKLYTFMKENSEYDCVCYCSKNNKSKFLRNIFIKYTKKITGIKNMDSCSNIKIMKKNVLPSIIEISNSKGYSNAIYDLIGFNIYYDYNYNGPVIKDDLLNYIFNYSFRPLKFLANCGLFIIFISLVYFMYSVFFSFNKMSLIIFLILFLSGLNICFLSTIGNYLASIINKNCTTPKYIVKEEIGFDENYL